jgi:uncharacterized protein YggU (UPF0235/DUF167 family)
MIMYILLDIKVKTRSSYTSCSRHPLYDLAMRVISAPCKGQANADVIAYVCRALSLPKQSVAIIKGCSSSCKRMSIKTDDKKEDVIDRLCAYRSKK